MKHLSLIVAFALGLLGTVFAQQLLAALNGHW